MALNHFGARHFAAWHFGTLHGQAATASTRVPIHRHPWIHPQPPVVRHARVRSWVERPVYGSPTAWQLAPVQLARVVPLRVQDCFAPLIARRGPYLARACPMYEAPLYCRHRASSVYHAQTKPALAIEPRVRQPARRGLPSPAVLSYFLNEIA